MFVLVALAAIGAVGFVVVPRIGFWLARHSGADRATILPWISVLLFVVAWRLPNPDLAGTSTFTQHAVGGGAACAVLGIYIALNTGLRSSVLRIGLAYAVAASMGTANELLELGYDQLRGTTMSADTSWDLLANSVGAVTAALFIELIIVSSGLMRDPNLQTSQTTAQGRWLNQPRRAETAADSAPCSLTGQATGTIISEREWLGGDAHTLSDD